MQDSAQNLMDQAADLVDRYGVLGVEAAGQAPGGLLPQAAGGEAAAFAAAFGSWRSRARAFLGEGTDGLPAWFANIQALLAHPRPAHMHTCVYRAGTRVTAPLRVCAGVRRQLGVPAERRHAGRASAGLVAGHDPRPAQLVLHGRIIGASRPLFPARPPSPLATPRFAQQPPPCRLQGPSKFVFLHDEDLRHRVEYEQKTGRGGMQPFGMQRTALEVGTVQELRKKVGTAFRRSRSDRPLDAAPVRFLPSFSTLPFPPSRSSLLPS